MIIYNPLPVALAHYERELLSTLGETGRNATVVSTINEGRGGAQKLRALLRHIRTARQLSRRDDEELLVIWPLLGWLELLLWRRQIRPAHVFMHDPIPLRRQIGMGKLAGLLARHLSHRVSPTIVCHSTLAIAATKDVVTDARTTLLPHPLIARHRARNRESALPVALVLGQYKPARDLEMLENIGQRLPIVGIAGRIAGRGWPEMDGWHVESRFLSEAEFDNELQSASCVVVPYLHYFQSGVAVRAVECGIPVVGVRHPFLDELLGADFPGRVSTPSSAASWVDAIALAAASADQPLDLFDSVSKSWRSWAAELTGP